VTRARHEDNVIHWAHQTENKKPKTGPELLQSVRNAVLADLMIKFLINFEKKFFSLIMNWQ
jgi:hypothetical protein